MSDSLTEVSFYNLTTLPIHKAAPKLIEKIYYSKQNLLVICPDNNLLKTLDDGLWAYSTKHFIPHGTCFDEFRQEQPVYLTNKFENSNKAKLVMTLTNIELESVNASKLLHMFDGNIPEQLEFARNKWKIMQKSGIELTYWQQKVDGSWEKK